MLLHLHNGDASADIARQSLMPGDHFAFREALIEGPAPVSVDGDEWRRRRAQHLSEAYGVEREQCERELLSQEEKLASFANYDEVVLWFEHDLFCQVHLIHLLNWFAQQKPGNTALSLVCIDSFPGKVNFRGLGELNADELNSLFPSRRPVTKDQLELATRAWGAYTSSDPREIQTLIETTPTALSFLVAALTAHLRRFPSIRNGLGMIENRCLEFIGSGRTRFDDLFATFCEAEAIYGLGDAQLWFSLQRLVSANQPLLNMEGAGRDGEIMSTDATFEITDLGKTISEGGGDFVLLNGIDHWLGGVYLFDERNLWRWDEEKEKVVLSRSH